MKLLYKLIGSFKAWLCRRDVHAWRIHPTIHGEHLTRVCERCYAEDWRQNEAQRWERTLFPPNSLMQ